MLLYAARPKYPPATDIRFLFHAADQEDADNKINGWNRYHGFTDAPGWGWNVAEEVDGAPANWMHDWIHDEWVDH